MTDTQPDLDDGREPPATNTPATVALVVGLLACIPATGLIAIPAGVLGLRRAGRIRGVGRAPAMLGLVLGLINVLWWSALGAGALQTKLAFQKGEPAIKATGQFVMLVGAGNVAQARTLCADTVDETRLTGLFEQITATGVMRQPNPYYGGAVHSDRDIEVQAELKFDTVTRVLVTHWTIESGSPKLTDFRLDAPVTTQPAPPPPARQR